LSQLIFMRSTATTRRSVSRQHDWVDERSRALDAAIAGKIRYSHALRLAVLPKRLVSEMASPLPG